MTIRCDAQTARFATVGDRLPTIEQCTIPASQIAVEPRHADFGRTAWLRDGEKMVGIPTLARVCHEHADLAYQHHRWEVGADFQEVCMACHYVSGDPATDNAHDNLCCGGRFSCQWVPPEYCATHDTRFQTIEGVTPPGEGTEEAAIGQ